MAYEKRKWVSGVTKCSAENFNHMEDGIEMAQKGVDELNTKLNNKYGRILIGSIYLDKCYIYTDEDGTFNVRIGDNSAYHYFTINAKGVFFDGIKIN